MSAPTRRSGRQRVLHLLKLLGPCTVVRLARRLRLTPMAVRQHLTVLHGERLVEFSDPRGKVGRPARVWRLALAAQDRFPDRHAEFAVTLLRTIRDHLGEAGLQRLTAKRVRKQAEAYRSRMPQDTAPLARRVATLAQIRRDEGYMAEWGRRGKATFEIIENHCSIARVARSCPELCADELSLFRAVLGNHIHVERVDHMLSGDRRCAYRITAPRRGSAVRRRSRP